MAACIKPAETSHKVCTLLADGFATYVGAIFGAVACVVTLACVMPLLKGRIFAAAEMAEK